MGVSNHLPQILLLQALPSLPVDLQQFLSQPLPPQLRRQPDTLLIARLQLVLPLPDIDNMEGVTTGVPLDHCLQHLDDLQPDIETTRIHVAMKTETLVPVEECLWILGVLTADFG